VKNRCEDKFRLAIAFRTATLCWLPTSSAAESLRNSAKVRPRVVTSVGQLPSHPKTRSLGSGDKLSSSTQDTSCPRQPHCREGTSIPGGVPNRANEQLRQAPSLPVSPVSRIHLGWLHPASAVGRHWLLARDRKTSPSYCQLSTFDESESRGLWTGRAFATARAAYRLSASNPWSFSFFVVLQIMRQSERPDAV